MKILGFLKDKQKRTNLIIWFLIAAIGIVVIWGFKHGSNPLHMNVSDNIQQIDLDTIYLKDSGVEVNFSDVILSDQNEMRKLIVSTQQGTVTTELTDFLLLFLRDPAVIAWIERNDPLLYCLLERPAQDHMGMTHHAGR